MKKIMALILVALTAVGAYRVFGGKDGKEELTERPALCLVVEADDLFGFDFEQLHDEIFDVVSKYGYIRAVAADGHPFVYVDVDIPLPDKRYTKTKQKKINETLTNEIIAMLNDISPKSPENDLLSAIKTGKQVLGRCRGTASKNMIVLSSGISRAGVLRFQDNTFEQNHKKGNSILSTNPGEVTAKLAEQYSIPDLSSLDSLVWYGCGSAAGRQQIPDSAAVKLQDLWICIMEDADCSPEFCDTTLSVEPFDTDLHSTVIDFGEDTIEISPPAIEVKFDECQLGFIANKADLRDEVKAREILRPYAEKIIEYSKNVNHSDPILYVVGMTATFGDPDRCIKLSQARAEKIRQLLVAEGCPKNLIGTVGLGQGGPDSMRVDDTVQTDNLDELEALRSQNRVVYLISPTSEKAELLGLS